MLFSEIALMLARVAKLMKSVFNCSATGQKESRLPVSESALLDSLLMLRYQAQTVATQITRVNELTIYRCCY